MIAHLDRPAEVIIDGAGNGAVVIGPVPVRCRWRLRRATASSPSGHDGTLRLYRGTAAGEFIDGTSSAGADASEWAAGGLVLHTGENIVAVWTDCTPGAVMRLVLAVDQES